MINQREFVGTVNDNLRLIKNLQNILSVDKLPLFAVILEGLTAEAPIESRSKR